MEEYLSCKYPHPSTCDLVIDGRWIMSDVGWRMAYDDWLFARANGFDGFIFPAQQTPDQYFPWNQAPGQTEHYLRKLSQRSESQNG